MFLCLFVPLCLNVKAYAFEKKLAHSLNHYIKGSIARKAGEIDESIKEYKKSLKTDYRNAVVHFNLGLSYLKKNNIAKAIRELRLAVKFDPEFIKAHALLAILYFTRDKSDEACREYEIALKKTSELEPKNIEIYKSLGLFYLKQKRLEAAENTYRFILETSSGDIDAHFYLGSIYEETAQRQKAIEEFKKVLELKPDYAEALNCLGYIYVEENRQFDQAEIMIKNALQIDPDNGAYIDSLGWFYFKQGNYLDALAQLRRAVGLISDPVVFDHLGDVLLKLNDFEGAKTNWHNSLKLNPFQDKVKEKIKGLNNVKP